MINPKHSRPIDVHRWSDHPEINALVDEIWAQHFADFEPKSTGPKPKARIRQQLKVLLLDLYVAWATDPDLSIGVSLSVNSWKVGSRYNALHLSKVIIDLIRRLHDVGLIDLSRGSYAHPGAKTNRSTRIRAAAPLRRAFAQARFELPDIRVARGRETVILRGDDGEGGPAKPLDYEDTPETVAMRVFLERYNELLSSHFIDVCSLERPFVERPISDGPRTGETQRIPIGPTNAFIRRVFSRGDWGLNGRFYGGWWQQIDRELRNHIFIDDMPTVEVDFRGLHIAILSKENGVALRDDPYELPEGLIPGTTQMEQRSLVKQLLLTAINARNERAAFYAFREAYPAGSRGKSLSNAALASVLEAFIAKYPHLDGCLCSDQGIRLMNVDSRIAAEVLAHFTNRAIPVLCIHDSFIISHQRTLDLIAVMQDVTTRFLGGPLRVSQDFPGIDQFMRHPANRIRDYWTFRDLPQRTLGYRYRLDQFRRRQGVMGVEEELEEVVKY